MQYLKVPLTLEELTLLTNLASDQLFRREFIDPKMPGHKADPTQVRTGNALVGRLRLMIGENKRTDAAPAPVKERIASTPKRAAGKVNAV